MLDYNIIRSAVSPEHITLAQILFGNLSSSSQTFIISFDFHKYKVSLRYPSLPSHMALVWPPGTETSAEKGSQCHHLQLVEMINSKKHVQFDTLNTGLLLLQREEIIYKSR